VTEIPDMALRFRGFLPVVIDLETGGFNPATDALLELAAITLRFEEGELVRGEHFFFHVEPFHGANLEPSALEFTGIDPRSPLRRAVGEKRALQEVTSQVRRCLHEAGCTRAVVVAHNAAFDLAFLNAAMERNEIKRNPFHPFSSFDTATLCGLAFGQTVLSRACEAAGLDFDSREAHSALYDCGRAAELFCLIVNRWRQLGGWPPARANRPR
jgi:ribonuclease T